MKRYYAIVLIFINVIGVSGDMVDTWNGSTFLRTLDASTGTSIIMNNNANLNGLIDGKRYCIFFAFNVNHLVQEIDTFPSIMVCAQIRTDSTHYAYSMFDLIQEDLTTLRWRIRNVVRDGSTIDAEDTGWNTISLNRWYFVKILIYRSGSNTYASGLVTDDLEQLWSMSSAYVATLAYNPTWTTEYSYIQWYGQADVGHHSATVLFSPFLRDYNIYGNGVPMPFDMTYAMGRSQSLPYSTTYGVMTWSEISLDELMLQDSLEKPIILNNSTEGSITEQTATTGGSFQEFLAPYLQDVCDGLDSALSLPSGNLYLGGWAQPVADLINTLYNSLIAPGFEFATDATIEGLKAIILSLAYLADGVAHAIGPVLEDSWSQISTWMSSKINFTGYEYYDVGQKMGEIVSELVDDLGDL